MAKPSKSIVDAWIALNRAQRYAFEAIEAELKSAGLPPLAWYDVLLELWRGPGGGPPPGGRLDKKFFFPYCIFRLVGGPGTREKGSRPPRAPHVPARWVAVNAERSAPRRRR